MNMSPSSALAFDSFGNNTNKRSLYVIIAGFIVILTLLLALIILVAKIDSVNNVVCKTEPVTIVPGDKEGASGHEGKSSGELKVPKCPLNPHSPTPELDKAKCILESYPLIDG